MRMRAECVPCQMKRALYEASLIPGTDEREVMEAVLKVCANHYPPPEGVSNNEVSSRIKEVLYRILGRDDPQIEIKRRSNQVALELLPEVERIVRESNDPFRATTLASIVGNVMDFGITGSASSPEYLSERFFDFFEEGLFVDNTDQIRREIAQVNEVLYIADNAGEIVFDTLLIKEIKRIGPEVTFMVRGKPILNDATMVDVNEIGLNDLVDRVTTTKSFGVGVVLSRIPADVQEEIFDAQLIVAKGMGNYEGLADAELPPTAFLLRTKCRPVAEDIGFPVNKNIAYFRA